MGLNWLELVPKAFERGNREGDSARMRACHHLQVFVAQNNSYLSKPDLAAELGSIRICDGFLHTAVFHFKVTCADLQMYVHFLLHL